LTCWEGSEYCSCLDETAGCYSCPTWAGHSALALLVASSFPQARSGQLVLLLLSSGHVVLPLLYMGRLFSFYVLLDASSLATALLRWLVLSRPSWDGLSFSGRCLAEAHFAPSPHRVPGFTPALLQWLFMPLAQIRSGWLCSFTA